ncbi:hypothetical protein E3N88_43255 [Mikania micrantha]|uniref:Eukaryotic translation initiation factor 3 subunit I n=1 Tax=Mikania micrantha TaxID=192012 RepID=A0A5N6LFF5_9ASTR|nr:hypothetical protein E3N88_43255 [Mikania micrantha]
MRPILMKGHERPLTFLKYNRDGDLLFSCAKDHTPTVWFADNGERLGTYRGHNGAVWCCDVSRDSTRLLTGSADQTAKLWDVQSGTQLFTFNFDSPARAVDFSVGDKLAVITTDPFMGLTSAIHVKRIAADSDDQVADSVLVLKGPQGRINRAVWGPLNKTIISAGEDAVIRIWDTETGKLLQENEKEIGHKKTITSLAKSIDCSHFLTGSLDKSAKLWDSRSLTLIKTYVTERPVNAVAMSPLLNHVVLGGGQDASAVTTTDHRAGKFEAKFYDKILQEEIGGVKGHFGPINALAFNPDGKRCVYLTTASDSNQTNCEKKGQVTKVQSLSIQQDVVVAEIDLSETTMGNVNSIWSKGEHTKTDNGETSSGMNSTFDVKSLMSE